MAGSYRPKEYKGEILLTTMFGVVAQNFLSEDIYKVSEDPALREALRVEGGPYCWTVEELEIPF